MARLLRNPFDRSAKVAPSHYPRLLFHGLRFFQLASSLIVGGIMAYFTYHLTHDHWKEPWTFIFLFAASLLSIAVLAFTIILHCFIGLNPRLNIALNSLLLVVWVVGWSMLTWFMSGTLRHACDYDTWTEDTGIMVCRIYKVLFTFSFVGMLSTGAALVLDVWVRGRQTARGIYRLQDLDGKRPHVEKAGLTANAAGYGQGGLQAPRESGAWEADARPSIGPYNERPSHEKEPLAQGMEAQEEQFGYDTRYHGPHSQRDLGA